MKALHANWAYVLLVSNLVVGVWGIVLYRRKREPSRTFWYSLAFAWITIWIQGFFGLAVYDRPVRAEFRHQFYGYLFAIITLAIFPLRTENKRRTLLLFSVASVFIGIVAVRAIISG